MKLNERLRLKHSEEALQAARGDVTESRDPEHNDPLAQLKVRTQEALFAKLGARLYDPSLSADELQRFVADEIAGAMGADASALTDEERRVLASQIRDDILGYGPVQMYLDDPTVTEIMVNAEESIYIERDGKLIATDTRFMSRQHLRRVIDRIVTGVGRRVDESSPMVDARLADGSRVNAIIPPLSVDGPILTIRKFAHDPFQVQDLIEMGSMTRLVADLCEAAVQGKLNIMVSGGTGTGKTTLLNVLSGFIPDDERIVTIEDAVELQLHQRHVIRLESRPSNVEGRGEVSIRDLVRNSLRMRPDRIIVGEARGGEALDMLQAMNTGHEGSLTTVHANTPRDALSRLETMVLMAGVDLPSRAIREQISSAFDLIVHITRMRDGSRRITDIAEVVGMEGDTITIQEIFTFDYKAGFDEDGRFAGVIRPTGIRPRFSEHLKDLGIELPAGVFGAPDLSSLTKKGRK
ncbi:MAG: CpaF family protein [Actinomycetia bacterium]|nr:CpaF family protein [Actinomycetes bacterium]